MGASPEEEIDLFQLMEYFKKGIKKFFIGIKNFSIKLFNFFILILLFLRKNIKLIVLPMMAAFLLGLFLDSISSVIYKYDAIIEPQYGSEHQINEYLEDIRSSIDNQDTLRLSTQLVITPEEAATITNLNLASYDSKIDKLLYFDRIIKKLDSTTRKNVNFSEFNKEIYTLFSKRFVIRVKSTDQNLKLSIDTIFNKIKQNKMLILAKDLRIKSIEEKEKNIKKSQKEVDSLRSFLKKYALNSLKKNVPNTTIDLSDKKNSENLELKLFGISKNLTEDLSKVILSKEKSGEIINVLTDFPQKGTKVEIPVFKTYKGMLPLVVVGTILLILLLSNLNTYLTNYKRENEYRKK